MKIFLNRPLAIMHIAFVFFIMSCTKNDAGALGAGQVEKPSISTEIEQGDIPQELKNLGFHVFPDPIALDSFSVTGLDGTIFTSDKNEGRVTLLNFWATWCPPCRVEMPSIEKLQTLMKGTDFQIVAISVGENKKTVQDFIKSSGYTFPVYLNESGSLGKMYASQGIPTTYILDKQGNVIAGAVGAREFDSIEIVSILKRLSQL